MRDRHTGTDDWVVPSVLIGLSLGILLMAGLGRPDPLRRFHRDRDSIRRVG